MTDDAINIQGFKLIELLSIDDIIPDNESPDKFKDIAGIPVVLTLDKVERFVGSKIDPYGSTVATYIHLNNKKVGLETEQYKKLQELSVELLEKDLIRNYADLEFVEEACFRWIIDVYKNKQARTDLVSFIKDYLDSELAYYSYYFKMESIGIKKPFSVGLVDITFFNKEFIDNEFELLNRQNKMSRDDFDKQYQVFFDKVIATVEVKAVQKKANKIAKREVNLSVNALKCILIHESIYKNNQIFDVDFNYHNSDFSKFLTRNDKINSVLDINLSRNFGTPIIITESLLNNYNKLGLSRLSEFLRNKKSTELYYKTEDAINYFGIAISTRDLYERVVKLISFFESIIIPKSNTRAKGQTYLKTNILIKLPINNVEQIKPIITRFYNIRDKYLHNRIELPIDLKELYMIQKVGLVFLLFLVKSNKTMDTLQEFLLHYNIK